MHSFGKNARASFNLGFTLIELMIAVAIVGVLAMVAMPSLLDSIRKGRRAEAFASIASIQQAQERWRSNNATYASSIAELGFTSSTTASGNYELSTSRSASGYIVTANGTTGSSQANDQCRKLSVQALGGTIKHAGCSSCIDFSYAETDPCWSR